MWFLQLSTFHAVSIIYDHVIKFFCLKSLLVNQLWTVWNCPLFQNDVPFDQPWDDPLNAEMMSSWVIKIEKFEGETTKLTIFTIKKTMTLTKKSWFSSSWTYVFTQEPVYRCIFRTFKSLREMKINNKTPLIRFKSVKPTCSIWRIRTILFVWSLWTILQAHLTVTSINLQPFESIN